MRIRFERIRTTGGTKIMNDFVDHEIWQVCRNCDHLETDYTYDEEQNKEYEYFYCCKAHPVSLVVNKDNDTCQDWELMR